MRQPISKFRTLLKFDKLHGAQNYSPLPVMINKGKGAFLYDVNDNKYYDFLSSYSSVNQGHCHPRLVNVMKKQCETLTLCSRAFHSEQLSLFYNFMNKTFNYDKCLPMNTGVEACETAIKLARLWGYKTKMIPHNKAEHVFPINNFWGRSIAACSSSTDESCYNNFGPFLPGIHFVEYNNIQHLERVFKDNPNICSYMMEPIQGEAGIIIPDDTYISNVRRLCTKYNVLFICDEVQTGLGRTGSLLCCEPNSIRRSTILPDILVLGKALTGGMIPMSCVLANNNIMDNIEPGTHGSTYGGNPLSSAVAIEAVNIVNNNTLNNNVLNRGSLFRDTIHDNFVGKGIVKDVRGRGFLNAVELDTPEIAKDVVTQLMKNGILTKITREKVIRLCPPLTLTSYQYDESLDIIINTLRGI